jgi:hypothetical protein
MNMMYKQGQVAKHSSLMPGQQENNQGMMQEHFRMEQQCIKMVKHDQGRFIGT